MKRVGIVFLLLAACSGASNLVNLDVNQGPVENGKTLKMEFREIERKVDESIVRVTFSSGGSVSSSMFVLKGSCAIAKSREAKFFRYVSETDGTGDEWVNTIAFATSPNDPSLKIPSPPMPVLEDEDEAFANGVFSFSDCQLLGFGR